MLVSAHQRQSGQTSLTVLTFIMENNKLRKKFQKLLKVKKHKSLSQGKINTFPCKECKRIFTRPGDLQRHIESTHRNIVHACPKCGQQFTRTYNARKHLLKCNKMPTLNSTLKVTPLKEAIRSGLISLPSTPEEDPKLTRFPSVPGTEQPIYTPQQRLNGGVSEDHKSQQFFQRLGAKNASGSASTSSHNAKPAQRLTFGVCENWSLTTNKTTPSPTPFSPLPPYLEEKGWLPAGSRSKTSTDPMEEDQDLLDMNLISCYWTHPVRCLSRPLSTAYWKRIWLYLPIQKMNALLLPPAQSREPQVPKLSQSSQ